MRLATSARAVACLERLQGSGVRQGAGLRREVALTFDDGPHPTWTPRVLDALDSMRAKATFFVVGRNAAAHRELVQEAAKRGHEIGTHLFTHRREVVFDESAFEDELLRSRDLLESLIGAPISWLRFPYGQRGRQNVHRILERHRMHTAHWSFSSHDSRARAAAEVTERVTAGLRPGAIVLFHDALADAERAPAPYIADRETTVRALPAIGKVLTRQRLSAVTLSELFLGAQTVQGLAVHRATPNRPR
jgi:peptidoglycan/xylan/chitin deacetylase (PgdA/CDA1 family)